MTDVGEDGGTVPAVLYMYVRTRGREFEVSRNDVFKWACLRSGVDGATDSLCVEPCGDIRSMRI